MTITPIISDLPPRCQRAPVPDRLEINAPQRHKEHGDQKEMGVENQNIQFLYFDCSSP
jgi:hypothetical protein